MIVLALVGDSTMTKMLINIRYNPSILADFGSKVNFMVLLRSYLAFTSMARIKGEQPDAGQGNTESVDMGEVFGKKAQKPEKVVKYREVATNIQVDEEALKEQPEAKKEAPKKRAVAKKPTHREPTAEEQETRNLEDLQNERFADEGYVHRLKWNYINGLIGKHTMIGGQLTEDFDTLKDFYKRKPDTKARSHSKELVQAAMAIFTDTDVLAAEKKAEETEKEEKKRQDQYRAVAKSKNDAKKAVKPVPPEPSGLLGKLKKFFKG